MNDCLVTKLKAEVNNNSLLKIGEMRVKFGTTTSRTTNTHSLKVFGSEPIKLRVVGTGFIATDINATSGASEVTIPAAVDSNTVPMYYVPAECEIAIEGKYAITYFRCGSAASADIDDLKFSAGLTYLNVNDAEGVTGNLTSLSDKTGLTSLMLRKTAVEGDLINLANLTSLAYMMLSNTNIEGNISNLAGLTAAVDFQFAYMPNIFGDIATLSGMTNINKLSFVNSLQVSGDATWYISKSGLQTYTDPFNYTQAIADISQLAADQAYIGAIGTADRTFTWTTQRHNVSGAKVVALQASAGYGGVKFGSALKAMLIDQSQCVFSPQGEASWYKTIDVAGTYDSTDAELATAISTIKSNGWTVKINGVTV